MVFYSLCVTRDGNARNKRNIVSNPLQPFLRRLYYWDRMCYLYGSLALTAVAFLIRERHNEVSRINPLKLLFSSYPSYYINGPSDLKVLITARERRWCQEIRWKKLLFEQVFRFLAFTFRLSGVFYSIISIVRIYSV